MTTTIIVAVTLVIIRTTVVIKPYQSHKLVFEFQSSAFIIF